MLVWLNQATHNYGWAIIVLTIIIKVVLYPLQHKSIVSMKKMQKVQPKVEAIKQKYKKARTDPEQRQKMNVEMMKLYQQEGINPMGGCLPIVLQLPILWGFYGLLSRAIELRGAPWILWIQDLSAKDPYYITPILMTITMFIQQAITPSTADPTQKRMFLIMNGISTSLPADVQDAVVHSLRGFENARIARYGYAVEYDFVNPEQLDPTMQARGIAGLFLAGQINGTSGYEEAGAQGLIAGINALQVVRGDEPMILRRDEAYAGVMIDDLVTLGVDEPYRMSPGTTTGGRDNLLSLW